VAKVGLIRTDSYSTLNTLYMEVQENLCV